MEAKPKPALPSAIVANSQMRRVLFCNTLINLLNQNKKCIIVALREAYSTYSQILNKNINKSEAINMANLIQAKTICYIDSTASEHIPYHNIPVSDATPPHYSPVPNYIIKCHYSQVINTIENINGYDYILIDDATSLKFLLNIEWPQLITWATLMNKMKSMATICMVSEYEINDTLLSQFENAMWTTIKPQSYSYDSNSLRLHAVIEDPTAKKATQIDVVDNMLYTYNS